MASPFEELGLQAELVQAVEKLGFDQPTPIQQAAIPVLLSGRNVVGQAQTGTGKTAAFALPMLQSIPMGTGTIQALVMAPTRELAIQVAEATSRMAQNMALRVLPVYGGQAYSIQTRQLKRGVDVVVGTPGRLLDLIRQEVLDLSHVRYLVLDEADEMLEMGFVEDVETILAQVAAERQIALFSATMPDAVRRLSEKYVSEPEIININPTRMTVAETEQRYCRVREENKLEALARLLEVEQVNSALIFARTKARAQELADTLIARGFPAESLHGDLSQARREFVLSRFRQHMVTLLVATDVAARGLDIENVSHVFNFDVPGDAEDYVHRIGRTGRAGRKGIAITFIHPRDRVRRKEIEAYTHQPMVECSVPTVETMQARRDERFIVHMYEQMMNGTAENDRALVAQMVEAGVDLVDIAAAAIRIARSSESSLPVGDISEPVYEPRAERKSRSAREPRTANEWRTAKEPRAAQEQRAPKEPRGSKSPRRQPEADYARDSQPRSEDKKWQKEPAYHRGGDRRQEQGMIRLRMNLGDRHGLRPGDVVGAIASEVGIPGKAIGEIIIQRDHTLVDVAEKHVRQVLKASAGQYVLHGRPVVLTLAN